MRKASIILSIILQMVVPASGQDAGKAAGQPSARPESGYIAPSEVNFRIGYDIRTFVVMAAINLAGFDSEPGGQPLSAARAELRRDLARVSPDIKRKLADFYKSHRRANIDEAVDATRYAALSLLMTQPPAFSIYEREANTIPPDLRPLLGFVPLVQQFYINSGIKDLFAKYDSIADVYVKAYNRPVGESIYRTLEYFHTRPQTVINMRPLVVTKDDPSGGKRQKQTVITRTRTRQLYLVPDPLSAIGSSVVRDDILNQKDELLARKIGDDYLIIVGPSRTPNTEAVRQAFIRYVIDPMIERHLRASLEYKDQITSLVAGVPTAGRQYGTSVYLVLRESLAEATAARIRRLIAIQTGGGYAEDEAAYDLAQAYLRGGVLAFHFYEALTGLEKVGINIEDFFDQMVATTKFDREAARSKEFEPVVARVLEARKSGAARSSSGVSEASVSPVARKILLSDDLIRERKHSEARVVLEEILALEPRNARALYGMAQVVNSIPSPAESDPKADENDKIQGQHERLKLAIELYKKAIENASKESEGWLIQWSHVFIGRIYDFQEFRSDAIAEYEKAIALGEVSPEAYKAALEGKARPYGQK
jgi:tetratricopeptide (TPR) repeat protein